MATKLTTATCAGCGKADHEFPVYSEEGNSANARLHLRSKP